MTLEEQPVESWQGWAEYEAARHGRAKAIARAAWPAGAVSMRECFGEDSFKKLPIRLRRAFGHRPWPTHGLHNRIIDQGYMPWTPPGKDERQSVEIIGEMVIRVNERKRRLWGNKLRLFNVYLLTRDWCLRTDEVEMLARTHQAITQVAALDMGVLHRRLKELVAPIPFFEGETGSWDAAKRMNPNLDIKWIEPDACSMGLE
jgi:hypothetical protein